MPYQLADCLIRLAPAKAEDAIQAGKLEESMRAAAEMLEGFAASQPTGRRRPTPCSRSAIVIRSWPECWRSRRNRPRNSPPPAPPMSNCCSGSRKARKSPQATFERAKCLAQQKDVNGAVNELRRFTNNDALKNAAIAPMALLELATLLRAQNQPLPAAEVLAQCRQQWEAKLQADPARAAWVPLLQYHQGVALREAGKRTEARAVFDLVAKQAMDRPEAGDAALRIGQCLKEDGQQKIADAAKRLASGNLKPDEIAAARKMKDEGVERPA